MKYRHAHHAGNFADVHKHVTLLTLLDSLKRKDKGFFFLDTHAGRGRYVPGDEARLGIGRFTGAEPRAAELRRYAETVTAFRAESGEPHAYPGSPLIAAGELRPQDRAILVEVEPAEARALERAVAPYRQARVERADGFAQLRALLPPRERRGLTFIDPPYEEARKDFSRIEEAIGEAFGKFATGVLAAWYPIKDQRDVDSWHRRLVAKFSVPMLASELWLYPRDSRVALNGSGLLIVNPPYQIPERMALWLPELHALLDESRSGGCRSVSLAA
jgi:23S rRNA (adenine2030-N6)-methyltransferase